MSPRAAIGLLFVGSAGAIAVVLLTQYVGGLAPCELCLYERWPYYAALVLSFLVLLPRTTPKSGAALLMLLFLASAGLAFYHAGVERAWFEGPTACTGTGGKAQTIAELRQMLMSQQPVRCDQPQWSFHGITLAGLNFLGSLALAALAAVALFDRGRRRRR